MLSAASVALLGRGASCSTVPTAQAARFGNASDGVRVQLGALYDLTTASRLAPAARAVRGWNLGC